MLALRILALFCAGIWVVGQMVPAAAHFVLAQWGWLRGAGLIAPAVAEALACVAMLRVLFGAAPDPSVLERHGVPRAVAKLMLAEVRFWR